MKSDALRPLFNPKTIALIGASREPKKLGQITLMNIIEGGFKGKIFPINPETTEVCGIRAYPNTLKVPDKTDLAIIAVPAAAVSDVIKDCAEKRHTSSRCCFSGIP